MIIGFSGYAQAGKDTAANILVDNHGFKRAAFADTLRDCLYALDPAVVLRPLLAVPAITTVTRLRDLVDEVGWSRAKLEHEDVRRLLQRLGTEAGRQILGEDIWVDTLFYRNRVDDLTISDVRFPNELRGIRERGGIVARIERPGVGPANSHISETALDDAKFDVRIQNDGSVKDLEVKVSGLLSLCPRL